MQLSDRQHAIIGIMVWILSSFLFDLYFHNSFVRFFALHFGSIISMFYIFTMDYIKYRIL